MTKPELEELAQQLTNENESLKNENEALKNENEALKNENEALTSALADKPTQETSRKAVLGIAV